MTHVSPACARRILPSAGGAVTPSHGSTPRATRSSKLNSPGSVLSNQMATWPVYAQLAFSQREPGGCGLPQKGGKSRQTFSGVHEGGSLAGKDSCDSSVTRSPSAVSSRLPCALLSGVPTAALVDDGLLDATLIRRASTPCVLGKRKLSTPFSMRASALSELTATGSVIDRCITP